MECVKSQVLLLFDIFVDGKNTGAVYQTKIFVMKLKFYRDSGQQIMDGITGDRPEILIVYGFKTILTIWIIYVLYMANITYIC